MAYHLEQTRQVDILKPLLTEITDEPFDMFIVTSDGETVETHKLLFTLFSQTFSSLLVGMNCLEKVGVSVPMPAVLVRNMIKILIGGRAYSYKQDHLLEVSSCGSFFGIQFQEMQVGSKKQKQKRKSDVSNDKTSDKQHCTSSCDDEGGTKQESKDNLAGIEVKVDVEDKNQEEINVDNYEEEIEEEFAEELAALETDLNESENVKVESDDAPKASMHSVKKFKCAECGRKYKNIQALNTHLNMQHSIKVAIELHCKECDKEFSSGQALQTHTRLHTGEKPYNCDFCDKSFTQHASLKSHQLVHDKESEEISMMKEKRKVECSDCGHLFVNKQVMKNHKVTVHSDEMPFKCSECEKCFKLENKLKFHMVIHSDERLFPCPSCNYYFKRKSELNKHVKKQSCVLKS